MLRCSFHPFFFLHGIPVVFVQVVQEVFVAKEWVRDAYNKARAEASSRAEIEKSLGDLKQEK